MEYEAVIYLRRSGKRKVRHICFGDLKTCQQQVQWRQEAFKQAEELSGIKLYLEAAVRKRKINV